jgi:16S rRNA (guanine1207-N2)-methyltransferase
MTRDALKALFHPFESGAIAMPGGGESLLFLGAEPGFHLADGFAASLALVQGFRPDFRLLEAIGHSVTPMPEGEEFDAALVLSGRHRGQNENRVAEAVARVKAEGLIVVAGGKEKGIGSLRKRVSELVPLEGQMPKHHGVAFWFRRPESAAGVLDALRSGNGEMIVEGRFRTAPGMFSHDRVDAGSRLLAESLPADMSGQIADFCTGWGFLAAEILSRAPAIGGLDLYEADFESLEAARANLATTSPDVPKRFFWHDLIGEPVTERYDAVVMNPPFHKDQAADPLIGQGMIKAAAAALRRGGWLFMVANRQLPYEATLASLFSAHSEIAGNGSFKVLSARR